MYLNGLMMPFLSETSSSDALEEEWNEVEWMLLEDDEDNYEDELYLPEEDGFYTPFDVMYADYQPERSPSSTSPDEESQQKSIHKTRKSRLNRKRYPLSKEARERRNQKRRVYAGPKLPCCRLRILKSDIRRNYGNMLVNVMNSFDSK